MSFVCEECGSGFSFKANLTRHIKTKHQVAEHYACPDCDKVFVRKDDLRTHRRIHTGEKPFACKSCGRKFARSSDCRSHERTHTNEKRQCPHCDRAYSRSHDLKKHCLEKHSGLPPPTAQRKKRKQPQAAEAAPAGAPAVLMPPPDHGPPRRRMPKPIGKRMGSLELLGVGIVAPTTPPVFTPLTPADAVYNGKRLRVADGSAQGAAPVAFPPHAAPALPPSPAGAHAAGFLSFPDDGQGQYMGGPMPSVREVPTPSGSTPSRSTPSAATPVGSPPVSTDVELLSYFAATSVPTEKLPVVSECAEEQCPDKGRPGLDLKTDDVVVFE